MSDMQAVFKWIDTFEPGDVFFDVGAGSGQCSRRAYIRGAFVQAFEPAYAPFRDLCHATNSLGFNDRLRCWPIALTDRPGLHTLYLQGYDSSFGEPLNTYLEKPDNVFFEQGCGGMTLDFFADTFGSPNHLLIDIGGLEYKVLKGAILTLKDTRLRSVVVRQNMNLVEHALIVPMLEQCGFAPRDAAVVNALSPHLEENLRYVVYNRTSEPKPCLLDAPFYRKTPMSASSITSSLLTSAITS